MQPRKLHQPPPGQKPVQQQLYAAIRQGDLSAIERCLMQGADPNAREIRFVKPSLEDTSGKDTEEGDTPLTLALSPWERGLKDDTREAIVRLLLDKGADANKGGVAGFTPLVDAVRFRHLRIARLLLQRGAKADQTTEYGSNALTFAINVRRLDLVELLLDHGANVNGPPGRKARIPLIDATFSREFDIMELLLRRGANPNIKWQGHTALEWALLDGDGDNIKSVRILDSVRARGRSWEELKAERDKERTQRDRRWEERSRREEAERKELAKRHAAKRIITVEDSQVLEAALIDILNYKGKELRVLSDERHEKTDILLWDKTVPGPPRESQMNGELTIEQARDITIEMRRDLMQRNYEAVSLAGVLQFKDRRIQVVPLDVKDLNSFTPDDWFEKPYPKARLAVTVHLPGYSATRDRAVLRFYPAPSPHGASGTMFLVKSLTGWQVKWRDFAYYV